MGGQRPVASLIFTTSNFLLLTDNTLAQGNPVLESDAGGGAKPSVEVKHH